MGRLKFWSNGDPARTKISVVDEAGAEMPLKMVDGVEFRMFASERGRPAAWLRLTGIAGNVVELDALVEDGVAARLVERMTGPLPEDPVQLRLDNLMLRGYLAGALDRWEGHLESAIDERGIDEDRAERDQIAQLRKFLADLEAGL